MLTFNPSEQYRYCKCVSRCYIGDAPTLHQLSETYGDEIAESWVACELKDLSEFSGAKDKLTIAQMDNLSKTICVCFPHLKVTELMHFFLMFKSGKYGSFYNKEDGLIVTKALRKFIDECNESRARYYQEAEAETKRIDDERRKESIAEFHAFLREYGITISDFLTTKLSVEEYKQTHKPKKLP